MIFYTQIVGKYLAKYGMKGEILPRASQPVGNMTLLGGTVSETGSATGSLQGNLLLPDPDERRSCSLPGVFP